MGYYTHRGTIFKMTKPKPKYTPRGYQTYILDSVKDLEGNNILIELDCGLGKRFITNQLITTRFPELKFVIVVHSTSSLAETVDYLRNEYSSIGDELGALSSIIKSGYRKKILEECRVIIATPQVLAGMVDKEPELLNTFDALLINEIDTIVRRMGRKTVLVFPWPKLITFFSEKWIIGMSGTLRDDHAVFTKEQLEIRNELNTIMEYIPDATLISMEDLYGTDIEDYLEPTFITMSTVSSSKIKSISLVLDELVRNTRIEIMNQLAESDNLDLVDGDARRVHLLLERLPITDELKSRYSGLLLLRKYVYGMPPKKFLKMFYSDFIKQYFNPSKLRRALPTISPKVTKVLEIALHYDKTVVLTSYLEIVSQVSDVLEKAGLTVYSITGQVRDKSTVLSDFKAEESTSALVMSPVGERDLDLPQADVMIICDAINTTKTMYQKFKRTRGGLVVLLAYEGTSEERKVNRLMQRVLERYPWSTAVMDFDLAVSDAL
jgi:ERCC4-related helicase